MKKNSLKFFIFLRGMTNVFFLLSFRHTHDTRNMMNFMKYFLDLSHYN